MTRDTFTSFNKWRTEFILFVCSVIGVAGLFHELFLTTHPNALKITASFVAITGGFAAWLNIIGKGGSS